MNNILKVGILGAGRIGGIMAQTLAQMEDAQAYAVAARSADRAAAFAAQFGVEQHYGSYEAMLEDPAVELVYIATPHSHHFEHIKLCLSHGKPVLCEKAFTVNAQQAQEAFALAKQKNLLLAEAIWTRYMPFSKTISELLASGAIGTVTGLWATLGYDVKNNERMHEPSLAGGALLDLGVYPLNFAMMALGSAYESVSSTMQRYHTGVDAQESITLTYPGGVMAVLYATMMNATDRRGVIYGQNGYMVIDNINNPQTATLYAPDHTVRAEHRAPQQISGYEYQVRACAKALQTGAVSCPEMAWSETVHVMQTMDALRAQWGLRYDGLE